MDTSGQNLIAAYQSMGYIYSSSNYGQSWSQTNCPYMNNIINMCISRNGQYAGVCGYNDYVYITPFSSGSTISYSQLVINLKYAQNSYTNAVNIYNNIASIFSFSYAIPTNPSVTNITNNTITTNYSILTNAQSYSIYLLLKTYTSGIQNILYNKFNSSLNGSATFNGLISNKLF
jgi:hypothetical protein